MTIADTLRAVSSRAEVDRALIALDTTRLPSSKKRSPRFRFRVPQGQCTFWARRVRDHIELHVEGATDDALRMLRNALVVHGGLRQRKGEHHVLRTFSPPTSAREICASIAAWSQYIQGYAEESYALGTLEKPAATDAELGIWWDGRSNFGDLLGPWLTQTFTARPALNARFSAAELPVLASVGSIIHMITHDATDIWGSGLMYPPTERQARRLSSLSGVRVHAVRGTKTRQALIDHLGWDVPEIYGDPALLLPRYLSPPPVTVDTDRPVAVVPHYKHVGMFPRRTSPHVKMVDVHEDLRSVVAEIAHSEVCISTSLHGIIIAQAYGVPWVWLKIVGRELEGTDFKFEDFFSTLDSAAVSRLEVDEATLAEGDYLRMAESATLPELRIDLDALEAAFPRARAETPMTPGQPTFSWGDVSTEDSVAAVGRAAVRRLKRGRRTIRRIPRTVSDKLPL